MFEAANKQEWQATSPNCLQRSSYKSGIPRQILELNALNALHDLVNVRAKLYEQLQAVDRSIAAHLSQVLNKLPQ